MTSLAAADHVVALSSSPVNGVEAATTQYDHLLSWMKQRLNLLGYPESSWISPSATDGSSSSSSPHQTVIVDFVSGYGPKMMLVKRVQQDAIVFSCNELKNELAGNNLCAYFIRNSAVLLTKDNVSREIQFGSIGGRGLSLIAFERVMKGLVEKQVAPSNELTSHFHRCMATLTDAMHFTDGRTVLYCPTFEFNTLSEASHDKERLQIMESIVIHWTRQIKDVVNNHDSSSSAENSGPLDEIEFWKGRAQDLVGIQLQLEGERVRRLIDVLNYAKSNYIGPFQTLTKLIVDRAVESNDNLKFLETIRVQSTSLRTIECNKIVQVLPDLLNRIRLIWSYSSYYNDNEHVAGILRKISNEIIRRFRTHIDIRDILDGDVEFAIFRLKEAISCGMQWKVMYHRSVSAIDRQKTKHGSAGWDLIDDASIFAQMDAFVQRCRDLIEVCESQMQFVRKSAATKGDPGPIPHFGGSKAQEIVDGIAGIQESFEHHIDRLRRLDYDILDVKGSKWHDDYNTFKNSVKDLDVMFTNVINAAFEFNSTVCDGAVVAETFYRLAKREVIMRCVERKSADTNHLFLKLVQTVRGEFEQSRLQPPLRSLEPQYAGSALWAHSLALLVKESYIAICRLKHVLPSREFSESKEAFNALFSVVQAFKHARYAVWLEDLNTKARDNGLQVRLDKPLLRRNLEGEGNARAGTEIICNFDEDLLSLFSEVTFWERFAGEFSIPYAAHDLCNKREQMRTMRENVILVVRAYNEIVREVNAEEKRLFADHIRKLDKRISQGLMKLTWQNRSLLEIFVRDCCSNCAEVHSVVREFKDCKAHLKRIQRQIATTALIRIDKNQIYEGGVFEKRQQEHRAQMYAFFEQGFNRGMSYMKNVYKNFRDGSSEVQREWRSQIAQVSE